MPLVKKTESEFGAIGIWEMMETLPDLIKHFHFSEKEKKDFDRLDSERKKREFLIIRLLTEELFGKKTGLTYEKSGKPCIENNGLNISVSHSEKMAAVFISRYNIGIDVESTQRNIQKITHRFLHESEWKFIEGNENSSLIATLIWCAKEAIYKCAGEKGIIFGKQIIINPPVPFGEELFFGRLVSNNKDKSFKLWNFAFKNNIVVYCVEEAKTGT